MCDKRDKLEIIDELQKIYNLQININSLLKYSYELKSEYQKPELRQIKKTLKYLMKSLNNIIT